MCQRTLLIALVAILVPTFGYGSESYFDLLGKEMNEAINSRYSCVDHITDEYSDNCTEIVTGYNYEDLIKLYNEATTVVNGICIYQLTITHEGVSQLTSVGALMLLLGKLSQNAVNETREQMYNLINLNDKNQVRYLIPKMATESAATSGDFISTITTKMFSNNAINENYQSCYSEVLKGETEVVDYSNSSAAAEEINAWFAAQTSFEGVDVVTADDIRNDTGLIFATCHNLEFEFDQFGFSEQVEIDFYLSKDNITKLAVWKGEGQAKYYYDEKLQSTVVRLPLKEDHYLLVIQPTVGGILDLLFYLRDNRNFAEVIDKLEDTYLNLLLPMNNYVVRSEDYVTGLQMANQLTPMYFSDFNGFWRILENGSGHVSHMYHQMHMSIKGLGQNVTTTNSESCTTRDVEVNSGFAFYVIDSSGTPVLCGTHLG